MVERNSASTYIGAGRIKGCMEIHVEACCQLGEKISDGGQSIIGALLGAVVIVQQTYELLQLASIKLAIVIRPVCINASSYPRCLLCRTPVKRPPSASYIWPMHQPPSALQSSQSRHLGLSSISSTAILLSSNPRYERVHSESRVSNLETQERTYPHQQPRTTTSQ